MKRASMALAALALVAFLWPGLTAHRFAAVAATPTPVALQYDQIVRMIIPPGTPPAPGQFQADYASIAGSGTTADSGATPTPAPHHGLSALVNTIVGGEAPGGGEGGLAGAMDRMRKGSLTRYTYYKGWIRTDDVVAQTATISKCDQHQFITLNLAAKTYAMTNTQPACNTRPPMPMGPQHSQVDDEAPGTADLTITASQQTLGPLTIENIPTTGYDNTIQMQSTNATGSCKDANMGMNMEQYVSKIGMPRQYCPIHATSFGENPTQMVVRGGCKPKMHVSGSMNGMTEMNALVMYSKMTANGAGGDSHMAGFGAVTERGNVKWLSGASADALFAIPPGFTQQS